LRIIIYGGSRIGYGLAAYFVGEENDVIIIDENTELLANISEDLDVKAVHGRGTYPEVLERAGAGQADLFIAATSYDEFNILACQVASSIFKIPLKIAYIHDLNYLQFKWDHFYSKEKAPIDFIISPEVGVAQAIIQNLEIPGAMTVIAIPDSTVRVVALRCPATCPLIHRPLAEIYDHFSDIPFKILMANREGRYALLSADDTLLPGDEVFFIAKLVDMKRIFFSFGIEIKSLSNLLILGGGNIGFKVGLTLSKTHPSVEIKFIEHSKSRAQYVAREISSAVVFQGSALDLTMLNEAMVSEADVVISTMNDDENNILASLLGKSMGAKFVSSLVSNDLYYQILPNLGIDSMVNPKLLTISEVLRHINPHKILSLYEFSKRFGGVYQVIVRSNSKILGGTVSSIEEKNHIIVGGVIRDRNFFIPASEELLKKGDKVIVVSTNSSKPRIEKLFKER
jgi:trk system potassium uptake protein TrkA